MRIEIQQYIKTWERRCYSNGLPDEVPREIDHLAPSYKRVAIAVFKNDVSHIGFAKPVSEYYGILKSIELNTPYKKHKRMTQQELKQSVFDLTDVIVKKQCYIKGYGDKLFRVMDKDHNPVRNITKREMDVLRFNTIVVQEGIVFVAVVTKNKFQTINDVRLPGKEEVV